MKSLKEKADILKTAFGLESEPIGVKFYEKDLSQSENGIQKAEDHRYCQIIMRARNGEALFNNSL